jgi:hypothetical protein
VSDVEWRELAREVYATGDILLAKKLVRVLTRFREQSDPTFTLLPAGPPEGMTGRVWTKVRNAIGRHAARRRQPTLRDLAKLLRSRRRSRCCGLRRGKTRAQLLQMIRAVGLDAPDEVKPRRARRRFRLSSAQDEGDEGEVFTVVRPRRGRRVRHARNPSEDARGAFGWT